MKNITFILLFIFLSTPALACRGVSQHVKVFFDALPQQVMDRSMIAQVEIQNDSTVNFQEYSEPGLTVSAIVKTAIKNTQLGQKIEIAYPTHTCYNGHNLKKGDTYFIAGELVDGVFKGEWTPSTKKQ